jgi:hypothetical protein
MGVLKFRLTPPDLSERLPELRRAYVTGLDRTPERMKPELRPGLLICHRDAPESARLNVPWPVEGVGLPFVGTATLVERAEPYDLAVELARGKLNDVRNQAAEWSHLGLRLPTEVEDDLAIARKSFARAATSRELPEQATAAAQETLIASFRAGRRLADAYSAQVLRKRLEHTPKLPTLLGCGLNADPAGTPWAGSLADACNSVRLRCTWADLAPGEGEYRWGSLDAQLDWAKRNQLMPLAGPLLDLRAAALPEWLWLWAGDPESITGMVVDMVRQAVTRYKGQVGAWHLVARPSVGEVLGLGEEEQIRLTARVIQVARQIDAATPLIVDFDRPWAEWLGQSGFQLGPLHLADSLARAEIGLSGVGIEVAPGYATPGSHLRDLFEFSRLLDLYALLNLPLYVTIALPSSADADPNVKDGAAVEASQWPGPPDETMQEGMAAAWIALAAAKPFVRAVTWAHATDSAPHFYANAGLFRADQKPKPVLRWIRAFRQANLS